MFEPRHPFGNSLAISFQGCAMPDYAIPARNVILLLII